jgi:hypothetical protein
MNIFAVHWDPHVSAISLPDKLVVKMPTESAQMLAHWAHFIHGVEIFKHDGTPYVISPRISSHPCTRWLYSNSDHVWWLLLHAHSLCIQYSQRYDKVINTLPAINSVIKLYRKHHSAPSNSELCYSLYPVLAMPDEYKDHSRPYTSYRNYLMNEKGYAVWNRGTPPPSWWDHEVHAPVRAKYLIDQELRKLVKRRRATLT